MVRKKTEAGESLTMVRVRHGYSFTYLKPCITDKQKRMAEIRLHMAHDTTPEKLAGKLESQYPGLSISKELGMALIKQDSAIIMVFSSGRIIIRQAKDEEEIISHAERIAKALSS